ncbi:hypothetical protein [Pseudomonas plecoglossicida]|uniref:hypothetical protein n=1 Tax=Pseudomonas plecoglossicida TaxID=70775 RepID=UPI003D1EF958
MKNLFFARSGPIAGKPGPTGICVGAGLPAIGPEQTQHIQLKNKTFKWPSGAFGHANHDIWREWKSPVVIEQFRGVLV